MRRIPAHIQSKLQEWVEAVGARGLEEVRKVPGYNDHPLTGKLKGKRAIRLNYTWRAVYVVKDDGVEFVSIEEVHPHAH